MEQTMPGQGLGGVTGYPGVDRPWLRFYSEEERTPPLPEETFWGLLRKRNEGYEEGSRSSTSVGG